MQFIQRNLRGTVVYVLTFVWEITGLIPEKPIGPNSHDKAILAQPTRGNTE